MKLCGYPHCICPYGFTLNTSSAGTGFNLSAPKARKQLRSITKSALIKHNSAAKHRSKNIDHGGTATVTGSFALDLGNLEATSGKVLVAVNTMQTGVICATAICREKDWLDAESNPNITFDIKNSLACKLSPSGGGKALPRQMPKVFSHCMA